jgi:hypothetical protein
MHSLTHQSLIDLISIACFEMFNCSKFASTSRMVIMEQLYR